jgi:hypothetical protein
MIEEVAKTNPCANDIKPQDLLERRYLAEMDSSGFFSQVWNEKRFGRSMIENGKSKIERPPISILNPQFSIRGFRLARREIVVFQIKPIPCVLAENVAQLVFSHTGNFFDFFYRIRELRVPVPVI